MTNLISKILHYGEAVINHAIDGFANVPEQVYNERLEVCLACPLMVDKECGICGCPIVKKALWASESCPAQPSKWGAYKETQQKEAASQPVESQPAAPAPATVSAKGGKGVCVPCQAGKRKSR